MIIKPEGIENHSINQFYLLGYDETGLSKAFAYILSKNSEFLFIFLRSIGLKIKNTSNRFRKISIQIEKKRDQGRTDIEIYSKNDFHVIIECKVGNNKIEKQREQYLEAFSEVPTKILCVLTQTNDYKLQVNNHIEIVNIGWNDIDNLIEDKLFENDPLMNDFQNYLRRGYNLRNQKEILIQDLGDKSELNKFKNCNIYRRDKIFGSPLYFAPYFTRNSGEVEGITYLSKVIGIISAKPNEIFSFQDELKTFAGKKNHLPDKWLSGVKLDSEDSVFTYFFLDDPVALPKPLLKDVGNKKGIGKDWISKMIPKNRCVSFEEFTNRLILSQQRNDSGII